MQLNEFKKDIIREIKQYFSDKTVDFVANESTLVPFTHIKIEFTMYGYFVVGLQIERQTIYFGIRENGIGLKLLETPLLAGPGETAKERIGLSALKKLDYEVRLRIPDKYLKEKGWM